MSDTVEYTQEQANAKALELVDRLNKKVKAFPKPTGLDVYKPKETDIVVTTFPKSGTTMSQQLTYQVLIATGGAGPKDPDGMNFEDICEVVPYVDFGPEHDFHDYESNPRLYKSHSTPTMFKDKIQKHLVVLRNPIAYPPSALDFLFDGWAEEKVTNMMVLEGVYRRFMAERVLGSVAGFGTSTTSEEKKEEAVLYFQKDVEGEEESAEKLTVGPWFMHAKGWMKAMRPNMLFMFYEDIVADMGTAAKRVARFMGRELDEAGLKQVLERMDREYMANDPKFKCTLENKALGFAADAWKAKPKDHKGFSFKVFKPTEEEKHQIALRFKQEFGVDSYEEFKEVIRAKQVEVGVTI